MPQHAPACAGMCQHVPACAPLARAEAAASAGEALAAMAEQAFDLVIRKCAEHTPQRVESWINDDIVEVYAELHRLGNAHSVECWIGGQLVGGLYGVSLGAAFFGESMFLV